MSNIVQFRELERAQREDSDEVVVYEGVVQDGGVVQDTPFAYLYLNSATYTLVWMGPHDFQFDAKLPFTFIKLQFSKLAQGEIDLVEFKLPERRPRSEAMARLKLFYYNSSMATLILADGTNQKLMEYDLLNNENDQREYLENVSKNPSQIIFSRYDSEVIDLKGNEAIPVNCCFTAERPHGESQDGWEFAISLPRKNLLEERTLKWITRSHKAKTVMRNLDFERAQAALAELLGLQTGPVSSEEIS